MDSLDEKTKTLNIIQGIEENEEEDDEENEEENDEEDNEKDEDKGNNTLNNKIIHQANTIEVSPKMFQQIQSFGENDKLSVADWVFTVETVLKTAKIVDDKEQLGSILPFVKGLAFQILRKHISKTGGSTWDAF